MKQYSLYFWDLSTQKWVMSMHFHTIQLYTLYAHAAASTLLCGLIWTVQVVQYPLFRKAEASFADFHAAHMARIGPLVGPLMLLEGATTMLLVLRPGNVPREAAWAGLGGLALVWLSTALLQVPAHRSLSRGFSAQLCDRLVATNWLRTVAWSVRAGLALWFLRIG